MPSIQATVQQQQPTLASKESTKDTTKTASNNQLNVIGGNKTPSEQPEYIKQTQIMIEKKVRNLEKRRSKLEEYQEIQKKGTQLNEDQLLAVSKYGEVKTSLELVKDLDKQLVALANDTMKAMKKQAKKEQAEKEEFLRERIREVQKIQLLLNTFLSESVRNDFLQGRNGAVQLTQQEVDLITDFQKLTLSTNLRNKTVDNELTESTDHFFNLVENKNKSVLSTTYNDFRKLIDKVLTSSYWTYEPEKEQPEQSQQQSTENVETSDEQKQSVNYQQNTSTEDYVIVSSNEVENTQIEQQQLISQSQQLTTQDQRTPFFSTLNPQQTTINNNNNNNLNQFQNNSTEAIDFLQDSQIQQQQYELQFQQDDLQQQQQQTHSGQDQQQFQNNNQQQDFAGGNHGGKYNNNYKPRHYNNDQNYQPRNNNNNNGNGGNGNVRRQYNQSDNIDRRGGRGGYQGGGRGGGPQGGRGVGGRGGNNYTRVPRGPPSGTGYRNNNQPEPRGDNH